MMKSRILALFFILLPLYIGYGQHRGPCDAFLIEDKPAYVIGEFEKNLTGKAYKLIWNYHVDRHGNIYVSDSVGITIDKYDSAGRYQCSFGHKGQGPGEFGAPPESFVVDSKGNLLALDMPKNKIYVFSPVGKFIREVKLLERFRTNFIKNMKINSDDELVILTRPANAGYAVGKYFLEIGAYTEFHSDSKRLRPHFGDILPDFDLNDAGDIFITDSIDYKIFKYSKSGRYVGSFDKPMNKRKITEDDFNINYSNRVIKLPGYESYWNRLAGSSRYWPCIFGINIDGNNVFVWTADQDLQKRYKVDIYNAEFVEICSSYWHNFLPQNRITIRNGKIYALNIANTDDDVFVRKIGRFGLMNIPYQIEVYETGKK